MRFDGKAVVVTGGALGIGQAAGEIFAERGASVAILDWDEKAGGETCEQIEAKGGRAIFEKVNVADWRLSKKRFKKRTTFSAKSTRSLSARASSVTARQFRPTTRNGKKF